MARSSFVYALFAVVACAGLARGDAGIPAPDIDFGFIFKNLDDYPNYDFYLKYSRSRGNPNANPHLTKVEPGKLMRLEGSGSRHSGIFLIAIPRGQDPGAPKKDNDWMKNPLPDGLQSAGLKGDPDGGRLVNGYDVTYRVKIADGKLEADCIDSSLNAWWSTARLIGILVAATCILVPVAIVVLIVLLVLRVTRKAAPSESEA